MRERGKKLGASEIEEIIAFHKAGVPKFHIAKIYHRHYSTIIYHLKKAQKILGMNFIVSHSLSKADYPALPLNDTENFEALIDEKKNSGHNYSWYISIEEEKKLLEQAQCAHAVCIRTIKCKCCGKNIVELV